MSINRKKLFVTNISSSVSESNIKDMFKRFGLCFCNLSKDKNSNQIAFIFYSSEYDAFS